MRRLAPIALAAALGCGKLSEAPAGPLDRFYHPTGIGVHEGKLIVASSNSDLRYASEDGGSVLTVDPGTGGTVAGINISSFAGQLAIADASACGIPETLALVPVRGESLLYRIGVGAGGALSCDGCALPLVGTFSDPFTVGVACDGQGFSRAYVGYLRSRDGVTWVTQIDLSPLADPAGTVQHQSYGPGAVRGFAFDASRRRLYLTSAATGASTALRWIDLAGDCRIDAPIGQGCRGNVTAAGAIPQGIELRGIALSSPPPSPLPLGAPRRAYFTARIYDVSLAIAVGGRVDDLGGLLLVVDLVDDANGNVDFRIVDEIPMGYGASEVRVLPPRPGLRDVVVALASDSGELLVYDDETGERAYFERDLTTGAPLLGRTPFGLAVDPTPQAGNALVYVGSFREDFVTALKVPLDDPGAACFVALPSLDCVTQPTHDGIPRITGVTP